MTLEEANAIPHGYVVAHLYDGEVIPGFYMGTTIGGKAISISSIALGMPALFQRHLEDVESIVPQEGELMVVDGPLVHRA